jgi:hypothetical protein
MGYSTDKDNLCRDGQSMIEVIEQFGCQLLIGLIREECFIKETQQLL